MPGAEGLRIGGLQSFSTSDWPGRMVAVLFLRGCPLACRYCHNPHLRDPHPTAQDVPWADAYDLLKRRIGLLDGVVISGGEPTIQSALPAALKAIRALGFQTGLHTAGPSPDRLERVLPLLDWVGFDLKAPIHGYAAVTGVAQAGPHAYESLRRLASSDVPFEVRVTAHPSLHENQDIEEMASSAAAAGANLFALQAATSKTILDPTLPAYSWASLPTLPPSISQQFSEVIYRDT